MTCFTERLSSTNKPTLTPTTPLPIIKSSNTNGDNNYFGGGVFARFEHTSNMHGEASLRVGSVEVNQNSQDYGGFIGQNINYSTSGVYFGAHVGLGYLLELNDANSFDFYTKYFWTHQGCDDATVAGNPFIFDDINSHRTRLGARYNAVCSVLYRCSVGA